MAPLPGQAARAARTIFPEDVVLRTSGNATITGIIGRVGGQSDEEASEASDDDGTPLVDGAATVRWLNSGISEVEQVGALRVVDRAFVHGDIVAPAVGPQAQSGTVVGISLALDVRLPSGTVREFVPSELIDHIKPFRPGTYAVYGTWLGRVDECMDNITLAFGDGGQVKLLRVHPDDVVAVHRSFDDHCPFFPGQLVKTRAGVLRRGKWVSGKYSREYADQIAVVSSVQPCRVAMRWLATRQGGELLSGESGAHPPDWVKPSELTALSVFIDNWWQVGDRGYAGPDVLEWSPAAAHASAALRAQAQTEPRTPAPPQPAGPEQPQRPPPPAAPLPAPAAPAAPAARRARRRGRGLPRRGQSSAAHCVEVVRTHTLVDVLWQDGQLQHSLAATSLVPAYHLGAYDFWPEEFVLEKPDEPLLAPPARQAGGGGVGAAEGGAAAEAARAGGGLGQRVGVLKWVDNSSRTLGVRWLDDDSPAAAPSAAPPAAVAAEAADASGAVEAMSVFDVLPHPDYRIRCGDVVLRLAPTEPPASGTAQLAAGGEEAHEAPAPQALQGASVQAAAAQAGSLIAAALAAATPGGAGAAVASAAPPAPAAAPAAARAGTAGAAGASSEASLAAASAAVQAAQESGDMEAFARAVSQALELAQADAEGTRSVHVRFGTGDGGSLASAIVSAVDSTGRTTRLDVAGRNGRPGRRAEEVGGWVGEVTRLCDGKVEVAWADGSCSALSPAEVFVVHSDDEEEGDEGASVAELSADGDGDGASSAGSSSSGSWRTVEDDDEAEGAQPATAAASAAAARARRGARRGAQAADDDDDEIRSDDEGGIPPLSDMSGSDIDSGSGSDESDGESDGSDESGFESDGISGSDDDSDALASDGGDEDEAERTAIALPPLSVTRENLPALAAAMARAAALVESVRSGAASGDGFPSVSALAAALNVAAAPGAEAADAAAPGSDVPGAPQPAAAPGAAAEGGAMAAAAVEAAAALARGGEAQPDAATLPGAQPPTPAPPSVPAAPPAAELPAAAADGAATVVCAPAAADSASAAGVGGEAAAASAAAPAAGGGGRGACEEMVVYAGHAQFSMADEVPRGHHFAAQPSSSASAAAPAAPALSRGFASAVQKEWRLLQRSLPPGIYVAACGSRMDLLRAVLFGPTGTPYADSPFVFDIALPADYPQTSPQVHYDSRTERIHPNLYENGKVCLSILGTWAGKGVEVWDPASSNLLRLLLSLQGLVLVPQPYYNEAGYEKQMGTAEGLHNSRLYNEGAFLLSQKLHVLLLRDLPQPFERLFRAHYAATAPRILARCRAVLDERRPPEGTPTGAEYPLCSQGLVYSLRKLMPRLEEALAPFLPQSPSAAPE